MSARTIRTGLLAATAILATLSLTACNGDDTQDEGGSTTSGASNENEESTTDGDQNDDQGSDQGDQDGDAAADSEGSTGSTDETNSTGSQDSPSDEDTEDTDSSRNEPCDGSNTETTLTEVSRPLNHVLLTVTNTGSENCDLLNYPILRFEGAQSVPPVFEDSKPQAVVTLTPGDSGYAGVLLASADGSGGDPITAENLDVLFNEDGTDSATPSLPAGGITFDSSLTVTYWQQNMDDALSW
jgi:hypothetical protein